MVFRGLGTPRLPAVFLMGVEAGVDGCGAVGG